MFAEKQIIKQPQERVLSPSIGLEEHGIGVGGERALSQAAASSQVRADDRHPFGYVVMTLAAALLFSPLAIAQAGGSQQNKGPDAVVSNTGSQQSPQTPNATGTLNSGGLSTGLQPSPVAGTKRATGKKARSGKAKDSKMKDEASKTRQGRPDSPNAMSGPESTTSGSK
jgi:hypothetical protein